MRDAGLPEIIERTNVFVFAGRVEDRPFTKFAENRLVFQVESVRSVLHVFRPRFFF